MLTYRSAFELLEPVVSLAWWEAPATGLRMCPTGKHPSPTICAPRLRADGSLLKNGWTGCWTGLKGCGVRSDGILTAHVGLSLRSLSFAVLDWISSIAFCIAEYSSDGSSSPAVSSLPASWFSSSISSFRLRMSSVSGEDALIGILLVFFAPLMVRKTSFGLE